MDRFSSFIISVSVSFLCMGTLTWLIPKNNLTKTVKFVFSLVFLCILLSVSSLFPGSELSDFSPRVKTEQPDENAQTITAKYVYADLLRKNQISFSKINVLTDNTEDSGIKISKIQIVTRESEEKIFSVLQEVKQNIPVEVIHESEIIE